MSGRWRRIRALWRRSPSTVLVATVATVVGVAALTLGAGLLFRNTDEGIQPDASPSTALAFAVLAGSTVKNTGLSVITGDVGGAKVGNAIVGFPPGVVNGTQHGADAVALQAQADLTTAYFDAANRVSNETLPPDVGGMTLVPGVYNQPTALTLTGAVILDGQNDPDALFVIQAGSTLVTAPGSVVSLVNGARSCNVFWQVGTSATLGTTTAFAGSILATSSVTLQNGATVDGRVLVRSGEVNLDTNIITRPSCDTPSSTPTLTPSAQAAGSFLPGATSSATPDPDDPGSNGTDSTTGTTTEQVVTTGTTPAGSSTETTTTETTATETTTTTTTTDTTTPEPPPPPDPPPDPPPPDPPTAPF